MIRSPYNFVPLNHDVFIPDWHDKVSHDVPLAESESGIIRFTITNLTAMHISQGKEKGKDGNTTNKSVFCHVEKNGNRQYIIPGSSIKGMLRSVAEVLAFAKLTQYNDDYLGYRIFMNPKSDDYKHYHQEMEKPLCGFLFREGNEYKIHSCGEPAQTAISEIQKHKADIEREGLTLVCSGAMQGKKHEYVFDKKLKGEILKVPDEVMKVFLSVYKPNKEFEGKIRNVKNGNELPVFYHLDRNGDVKHLGLSKNYRLPYSKNIKSAIIQQCKNLKGKLVDGHDMVETLFGYTSKDSSLKGRVQVSHAFCQNMVPENEMVSVKGVLGQPQASYTPLYLKQDTPGKYKSYNDSDAEIAGRKRYRIHSNDNITGIPQGNGNDKVMSKLELLPAGNSFDVVIAVHNLKPCEIGLILSALTFHNTANVYHNIGMGKSFGYGKLSVKDVKLEGFKDTDVSSYIKAFEKIMCTFTSVTQSCDWSMSEPIKALFAIAADHSEDLSLMTLNEYTDSKQNKNYSKLKETCIAVNSLASRKEMIEEEQHREEEMLAREKEEYEKNKAIEAQINSLISKIESLVNENELDEAESQCKQVNRDYPHVDIEHLKRQIENKRRVSNETLTDFVVRLRISDLKRFNDELKRRIKIIPIKMADLDTLASVKSRIDPKKKDWTDYSRWKNIEKTLGKDIAKALFDKLNS